MNVNFDNLKRLLESLKTIGFLERLFSWNRIKLQLIDANGDLQKLLVRVEEFIKLESLFNLEKSNGKNLSDTVNRLHTENEVLKESNKKLDLFQKELTTLTEANKNYLRRGTELSNEVAILKQKLEQTERELQKVVQQNTEYAKNDEFRTKFRVIATKNWKSARMPRYSAFRSYAKPGPTIRIT
jgi:predicted RNase H-like nuclease (RuvC/YqgF family)